MNRLSRAILIAATLLIGVAYLGPALLGASQGRHRCLPESESMSRYLVGLSSADRPAGGVKVGVPFPEIRENGSGAHAFLLSLVTSSSGIEPSRIGDDLPLRTTPDALAALRDGQAPVFLRLAEGDPDALKMARQLVETRFQGAERQSALRSLIPVLSLSEAVDTSADRRATRPARLLIDNLIYARDNFGCLGFLPPGDWTEAQWNEIAQRIAAKSGPFERARLGLCRNRGSLLYLASFLMAAGLLLLWIRRRRG